MFIPMMVGGLAAMVLAAGCEGLAQRAEAPETECDRLAANPADVRRVAPGVTLEVIEVERAMAACRTAVRDHPRSRRLRYQLGRSLVLAGQHEEGLEISWKVLEEGYGAAVFTINHHFVEVLGDYLGAFEFLYPLAEGGMAEAQVALGVLYHNGQGVAQDHEPAARWYELAAEQGIVSAQSSLGSLYDLGLGVDQSYAQAALWYTRAAEQGDARAQSSLGSLYNLGLGVDQSYAQAALWYARAAEQGDARAQNNLGILYLEGRGVSQSYDQAEYWLEKSAGQGLSEAETNLEVLQARRGG